MKVLTVLLVVVGVVLANDFIPINKVEELATRYVNQKFGNYFLDEAIEYYGLDDAPCAYAMIYRNYNNEPLTIVMGARYTTSPVNETAQALPQHRYAYEMVLNKARTLGHVEPAFQKIYYFGPGEEYCAFSIGEKEYLVNTYSFNAIEKSSFMQNVPEPNKELEQLTRQKWNKYFNTANFTARQDTGYVPNVPFIDWTYGCSPTAASMILWYWDQFAPNPQYGRLVDHFFTRWELLYEAYKDQANVNRELAIAMHTDSTTGGTYINWIGPGMQTVANSWNGYSASVATSSQGNSGNQYMFSWIKTEIDAGRPCHWNVFDLYPMVWNAGHSITGVGYATVPGDTFIRVHTTWGWSGEPLWPLWTYHLGVYSRDYVIKFIPGGGINDNIFLDFPLAGFVFKNLKYKIKWTTLGTDIDHVKIWWSMGKQATSYDSLYWTLITSNAPNTGEYIWTAPDQDSSLRINIAGLNASNQRLAADGSLNKTMCVFPDHSTNLTLVGHFGEINGANDVKVVDNYAYIANGTGGFFVVDISDSSFPDYVSDLPLPGDIASLDLSGSYAYLSDKTDTLRVISISNPVNPSQVGKLGLVVDQPLGIFVDDTLVYLACRGSGIVIINAADPLSPALIGSYNTPGQAYDVLVSDTLAYVADGTRGIRIIDVSDPTNPVEIGFYDTNGVTQGLSLVGIYLYLAEGGGGIKVFDVSDPTNPQQLGAYDTPGTARSVTYTDSLYVCDASNGLLVLDVSNPSSPVPIGYIESYGTATNLCHIGSMLYLADFSDGLYLIHEDIPPGIEENKAQISLANLVLQSPQTGLLKLNLHLRDKANNVSVKLYDAAGQLVKSFYKEGLHQGEYGFKWRTEASGVYFVKVKINKSTMIKKVVVIK